MKSLFLFFILIFSYVAEAQDKVCVLSLFKLDSKEDKTVKNAFLKADTNKMIDPSIILFREAHISDINSCFQEENYKEVVFLAHGTAINNSISDFSMPILDSSDPNQKTLLYPRYFKKLSQMLLNNHSIKKLRVSACGIDFHLSSELSETSSSNRESEPIQSTIDILTHTASEKGIEVDLSEKSEFGSWMLQGNVTDLTKSWLRQSLDQNKLRKYELSKNSVRLKM